MKEAVVHPPSGIAVHVRMETAVSTPLQALSSLEERRPVRHLLASCKTLLTYGPPLQLCCYCSTSQLMHYDPGGRWHAA